MQKSLYTREYQRMLMLLHDESLAQHGGLSGLRDEGLLDSALARPQNLATYGDPDLAALAASYAFGLVRNHPFVDGNKRAAFLGVQLLDGFPNTRDNVAGRLPELFVEAGFHGVSETRSFPTVLGSMSLYRAIKA